MYTDLKSYQLIISLLKQYGITHCVLSAEAGMYHLSIR